MTAYRKRNLEPLSHRLKHAIARLLKGIRQRQSVYAVSIHNARLKHVVLPDACVAETIAQNLQRMGRSDAFPALVAHYRNELWVEFIDGELLSAAVAPVDEIARIFSLLYRTDSYQVVPEQRDFVAEVVNDLELLARSGVIDGAITRKLTDLAERSAPKQAWFGYDYNDARPQNFVRAVDGRLIAIDVESIQRNTLLGTGAMRACARWPGLDRTAFLERLREHAPTFHDYLDFVELASHASWSKRGVLRRKAWKIDRRWFEQLAVRA